MPIFHILNGDALLNFFPEHILSGEIIVARECLVDGPVAGDDLESFWNTRASFISEEFSEPEEVYFSEVVSEFAKILSIPNGSEVNLWFEEDLFCQVNLWFCISLLGQNSKGLTINLVKPLSKDGKPDWNGFGGLDRSELAEAYQERQLLSASDIDYLSTLWDAFKNDERPRLAELATQSISLLPFLPKVIQAHLDRFSNDNLSGRPENVLTEIMREENTQDFRTIFKQWRAKEGIYGFGDSQVERILRKLPVI